MEIGVIPHKYKYVKLSKEEKSETHGRKTSALSARKLAAVPKMHARRTPKNSNEPLLGFGTKTVSRTLAEREKIYIKK